MEPLKPVPRLMNLELFDGTSGHHGRREMVRSAKPLLLPYLGAMQIVGMSVDLR